MAIILRRPLALVLWVLGIFALNQAAGNGPGIPPVWEEGDVFRVEYRIPTSLSPKRRGGEVKGEDHFVVVHHEVIKVKKDKETGKTLTEIKVTLPISRRLKENYLFVYEESPRVLKTVVSLARGRFTEPNPFGMDSVMFLPREYTAFIADFARLPQPLQNETRRIDIPEGGSAVLPFEQKIVLANGNRVDIEMRRTVEEGQVQVATQTWEAGKKWWTTAEVTLDGELLIRGRLLEGQEDEEAARREQEAEKEREAEGREE